MMYPTTVPTLYLNIFLNRAPPPPKSPTADLGRLKQGWETFCRLGCGRNMGVIVG